MYIPSYWFVEIPDETHFQALEGDREADVAIIGGGIAGISAAYFCVKAGLKTILLEMGNLGTGDTGYTTAFAAHFLDSVEQTVMAWQASGEGLELFRKIIAQEGIECDWKDMDEIGFTRKDDISVFQKDYETFRAADPSLEYFEGDAASKLVGFSVQAAVRNKNEGQFHIRKFLLGFAHKIVASGGIIHEQTEVQSIEDSIEISGFINLRTPKGSIKTKKLIIATGQPLPKFFPMVSKMLRPAITYVIQLSCPNSKPFEKAMFWDDEEPFHYFRWVSATEAILGGEDYWISAKKPEDNAFIKLESWFKEASGNTNFTVANKWQGIIFYSPDTLPLIGTREAHSENVIFLTGFAGNGMAHGLLSGQIAADFVQGKKNMYQELFSMKRFV